jgi:hypothetical protein
MEDGGILTRGGSLLIGESVVAIQAPSARAGFDNGRMVVARGDTVEVASEAVQNMVRGQSIILVPRDFRKRFFGIRAVDDVGVPYEVPPAFETGVTHYINGLYAEQHLEDGSPLWPVIPSRSLAQGVLRSLEMPAIDSQRTI